MTPNTVVRIDQMHSCNALLFCTLLPYVNNLELLPVKAFRKCAVCMGYLFKTQALERSALGWS